MRRLGALGSAALLVLAIAPTGAFACGAEGCPYMKDALGSHTRRATFMLRYEVSPQDMLWNGSSQADRDELIQETFASGGMHEELELYTHTAAWILDGRAQVNDRLELTASLPYIQREHHHMLVHAPFYNPAFEDQWIYEGLGDAVALGHYRAWGAAEGGSLTLRGGVKLPTGVRHVPDEEKLNLGMHSMLDPPVRPGTGSTDWLLGAEVARPLPLRNALPLSASVMFRWNGVGTEDYRVGNEIQAGLGSGYAPMPWLTLIAQANYVANAEDTPGDPAEPSHPGGRALYLTPGATARITNMFSMYALYQSRVWGYTDDANVVGKGHLVIGTSFTPGP